MYRLTFDTETTGLPLKQDNDYANPKETAFYNTSRLLQISWICTFGNIVKQKRNFYVKTDIVINNSHIHGIDKKIIDEKGIDINEIFAMLQNDLKEIKMIIGYNVDFDLNIILSELYRFENIYIDLINTIQKIEKFDVMIYAIIFFKEEKYMKLIKLYELLFKGNYNGAHDALNDVIATFKCFIKLVYGENVIELLEN
jgi:DNA polymerase-3 subunit alpha